LVDWIASTEANLLITGTMIIVRQAFRMTGFIVL